MGARSSFTAGLLIKLCPCIPVVGSGDGTTMDVGAVVGDGTTTDVGAVVGDGSTTVVDAVVGELTSSVDKAINSVYCINRMFC